MKKKLLLVTDVMSPGGVESVIVTTLQGLNYDKFDTTLLIMYKKEEEKDNLRKIPDAVNIRYLFQKPPKQYLQVILYYLMILLPPFITNKFLVKEPYDIVVTTKEVFTYPISAAKCKKVMWIHSGLEHLRTEQSTVTNKLKNVIKEAKYRKFDNILLLTNRAKESFCTQFSLSSKCYVLPNPINNDVVETLAKEPVTDYQFNSGLTIVCSSRLSIEKGVERLIKVCERLFRQGYEFHVLILGDGPERAHLDNIISTNSILKEKIMMLGYKENPFKYMGKASLYVSPSFTEGFSLSIAEAMIAGLPILSTYCNGPAEILDDGKYGLLVENNENGLFEGIKRFISTPDILEDYRMKSAERKVFFQYKTTIELFEEIILT